jgi:cytidylate kinase
MTKAAHEVTDSIARTAERQMRMWATALEVQQRVDKEHSVEMLPDHIFPYVTISRETGAGGTTVAQQVADRLKVEFLDRELLHYMAESYNLPQDMLEFVDETTFNWVHDLFGHWLSRRVVTQAEYVHRLGYVLLMAARNHSYVVVGRDRGVHIRIIAPRAQRIRRMMELLQCDRDHAARRIQETDQQRSEFVKRYFHKDADDPHLYDLVINLGYVETESAVEMTVRCFERRFGGRLRPVIPAEQSRPIQPVSISHH